jgi:glycosyltransferase involved in cell wall biosynthesis
MIVSSLGRGGSERQLLITIAGLRQQGYDIRLIALARLDAGSPSIELEIERLGVQPRYCSDVGVPRYGRWSSAPAGDEIAADLAVVPRWISNKFDPLLTAIESHRPAIVHAWLDGPAVIGGLAACVAGVPRIVVAQGSMSVRHRRSKPNLHLRSAYQYVARNPAVMLVNNSAAGAEDYERWLDVPRGTIRVLRNGLMPGTVRVPDVQEVRDFRIRLGIPADALVVGTLMRLVDEKDPDLWIDTAAEIVKARPDIRFLIIGHGPLHGSILRRARRRELSERLVLTDSMSDVGLGYAALDVLLLTSSVEGLPNALVEAQAAGRPVVATDVGGTREAIDDGRTGLIVAQRSPRLLAQAVLRVLADASFRERVRTEGPSFAARQFGYERMLRETIGLYRLPATRG